MSDDLIEKADAFLAHMAHEMQNICDYCQRDKAEELVPELVAEVKRLREEKSDMEHIFECISKLMHAEVKSYAKFSALHFEATTTIMDAWQEQKEQLAAKDAELARWQKIAIEVKAEYQKDAAKELVVQISQEASYLSRLEEAFTTLYIMHLESMDRDTSEKHAQNALERIRKCHP